MILKDIVPMLKSQGFVLAHSSTGCYDFRNTDGSRLIRYDFPPFERLKLRISFSVIGKNKFSLEMDEFKRIYDGSYSDQKGLDHLLLQATSDIIDILLPYLSLLDDAYIQAAPNLYSAFSISPVDRAHAFADKFGYSISPDISYSFLKPFMKFICPCDPCARKEKFGHVQDDILGCAAFIGECLKTQREALHWGWSETPEYSARTLERFQPLRQFGLILHQGQTRLEFDTLSRTLYEWNFFGLECLAPQKESD